MSGTFCDSFLSNLTPSEPVLIHGNDLANSPVSFSVTMFLLTVNAKRSISVIRLGEEHPDERYLLFGSNIMVSSPKANKSNIQ